MEAPYSYKLRPGYGTSEYLIEMGRGDPDEVMDVLQKLLAENGFMLEGASDVWMNDEIWLHISHPVHGRVLLTKDIWGFIFILGEGNQIGVLEIDTILENSELFESEPVDPNEYKGSGTVEKAAESAGPQESSKPDDSPGFKDLACIALPDLPPGQQPFTGWLWLFEDHVNEVLPEQDYAVIKAHFCVHRTPGREVLIRGERIDEPHQEYADCLKEAVEALVSASPTLLPGLQIEIREPYVLSGNYSHVATTAYLKNWLRRLVDRISN